MLHSRDVLSHRAHQSHSFRANELPRALPGKTCALTIARETRRDSRPPTIQRTFRPANSTPFGRSTADRRWWSDRLIDSSNAQSIAKGRCAMAPSSAIGTNSPGYGIERDRSDCFVRRTARHRGRRGDDFPFRLFLPPPGNAVQHAAVYATGSDSRISWCRSVLPDERFRDGPRSRAEAGVELASTLAGICSYALRPRLSAVRSHHTGHGGYARLTHIPLSGISFSDRSLLLQPLLLQQWGGDLSWNYPSWSVSTEAEVYAFFVFSAGTLVTGKYPHASTATCVAILAVLFITHGDWLNLFTGVPALLRAISEFSLGALLYRSHLAAKTSSGILPALFAVVCIAFAALTRWDIATVGVLACVVYYSVIPTSYLARLLNSAPAIAVGSWSYSIFLWHAPVHYAVMAMFSACGHPTQALGVTAARLLMMTTMLGVVCLSALTFKYFEVPARRLIRRRLLQEKRSRDTSIAASGTGDAGESLTH